jgi:hypothetical protein
VSFSKMSRSTYDLANCSSGLIATGFAKGVLVKRH